MVFTPQIKFPRRLKKLSLFVNFFLISFRFFFQSVTLWAPPTFQSDFNKSALDLSKPTVVTKRSKHMDLRYHMVRDYSKYLCYCPTDLNLSDALTKPVDSSKYNAMFLIKLKQTQTETQKVTAKLVYIN